MISWSCVGCRTPYVSQNYTACMCRRAHMVLTLPICHSNECGYFGRCKKGGMGCTLINKACDHKRHLANGGGCLADSPLFNPANHKGSDCFYPKKGVGFLSTTYLTTGGTEIWHRTLLPRMKNVAGFVCIEPSLVKGDPKLLGCPFGIGLEDAKNLAEKCDTLVVWGVGERLTEVMNGLKNRPRVVSVSHCDNRSQWTKDYMNGQSRYSDHYVYLCPTGIETVPVSGRANAIMIPNAPDPLRIVPEHSAQEILSELGFGPENRILLTVSRISPEKRIEVLVDAMEHLPEEYRLVVVGPPNGFVASYRGDIQNKAASSNGRVVLLDPVETPGDLLSVAYAALSASSYEGYGLSMTEAVLAGVPLIATQTGVLEYHPEWALILPHEAGAKEWAEAILNDRPTQRAKTAQREISEYHSVERFVEEWERVTLSNERRSTTTSRG